MPSRIRQNVTASKRTKNSNQLRLERGSHGRRQRGPLLTLDECFVYKVPPRTSSEGYRAEIWGLDKPVQTCSLRVATLGDAILLRLFHPKPPGETTEKLFAVATIPTSEALEKGLDYFVEPVMDSSRYFVLRIVNNANGRVAYLGAGFRERQMAFDFRATLTDHLKFVERQRKGLDAALDASSGVITIAGGYDEEAEPPVSVTVADVLQPLAAGVMRLNVKPLGGKKDGAPSSGTGERKPSIGVGLAPPPRAGPSLFSPLSAPAVAPSTTIPADTAATEPAEDDEWGDFQSS